MRRRAFLAAFGAAAALPLVARAQQQAVPVIGWLGDRATPPPGLLAAFRRGLKETGYVEGENVTIEYRGAGGDLERLPALAADLVGRNVSVIVASPFSPALALKKVTSTIPVVFVSGMDPVAAGLVASLARPGGNLTGVNFFTAELVPKRIDL
ncbi:MAG: ABC transporter substrate binding protein, partial [Thiohalocapsa sp.]